MKNVNFYFIKRKGIITIFPSLEIQFAKSKKRGIYIDIEFTFIIWMFGINKNYKR